MQASKAAEDNSNKRASIALCPPPTTAEVKLPQRESRSSSVVQRVFSHVQDVMTSATASSSKSRSMSAHRSLPAALVPGSDVGLNDLTTILQSLSLAPGPLIMLPDEAKLRCDSFKDGKISPQQFYDYLDEKSVVLEDHMRLVFDFVKGLPKASDLFKQFLEMAGVKEDPGVPWRGRVVGLRFYIFIMQEGVAATLEKYPFATAAYRAVCDTVNLNCKPNIPPPSITSPHIQKAKEILYSRLSKLATAAAVDRRIIDCLRHIAEIAYARKFVVKGPEHFAFSTFLLRVVNSEILTVCSQLENSSDQRLKFIGLNMKTLSICLQGDFNKMKEDDVKRDAHFGPMLKALLG